jgi:hypothetical protein
MKACSWKRKLSIAAHSSIHEDLAGEFFVFYKKRCLKCATLLRKKGYLLEIMISKFMNASYGYSMNKNSEEEELLI